MTLSGERLAGRGPYLRRRKIGQGDAVDPFQGQKAPCGPLPIDLRNPEIAILRLGDVSRHFGDRRRLKPQVHLQQHRLRGSVSTGGDGPEPARLRGESVQPRVPRNRSFSRSRSNRLSMPGLKIFTATACGPSFRLHERLVHLCDGGGRDGRAELAVDGRTRAYESGFDVRLWPAPPGKGGEAVAQRAQGAG